MGSTKVRDSMTANPMAIEADQPIVKAAELMAKENVGSLPVIENGVLSGSSPTATSSSRSSPAGSTQPASR